MGLFAAAMIPSRGDDAYRVGGEEIRPVSSHACTTKSDTIEKRVKPSRLCKQDSEGLTCLTEDGHIRNTIINEFPPEIEDKILCHLIILPGIKVGSSLGLHGFNTIHLSGEEGTLVLVKFRLVG